MSRPQEPHKPFLPFGNPFRRILPKGTYLTPNLLTLLNNFEKSLSETLKNLKPETKSEILTLSWMKLATQSLCSIHSNIKSLITSLELPISDWDDKWIDIYLDNSVKLLDVGNLFTSEISRLNQGHLFLNCALHTLNSENSEHSTNSKAKTSLNQWAHHVNLKNPRLEKCFEILNDLISTLDLPKIKNNGKGKVLMRAMYGVKVVTVFICSVFGSALVGSAEKIVDLKPFSDCIWCEDFMDLQGFVNSEIRRVYLSGKVSVLKEVEEVDVNVKCVINESEVKKDLVMELGKSVEKLSDGLDLLGKEVDEFFRIVLSGRDALLCNLRVGINLVENDEQFVK